MPEPVTLPNLLPTLTDLGDRFPFRSAVHVPWACHLTVQQRQLLAWGELGQRTGRCTYRLAALWAAVDGQVLLERRQALARWAEQTAYLATALRQVRASLS